RPVQDCEGPALFRGDHAPSQPAPRQTGNEESSPFFSLGRTFYQSIRLRVRKRDRETILSIAASQPYVAASDRGYARASDYQSSQPWTNLRCVGNNSYS
ncbi:hypothetical protein TSAR_011959, partial [Trichomalopsis sarcophagae]